MKVKFSKFERVAGIFVLSAMIGTAAATIGVAIKKGWFEPKVRYFTKTENAGGIHPGTIVLINGIRAGAVEEVFLKGENEVSLKFYILERFQNKIKEDSYLVLTRQFIIGDKVLDIKIGTEDSPVVIPGSVIEARMGFDLIDLFSGNVMGEYLNLTMGVMENLKIVAEAFLDPERTRSLVKTFDQLEPLVGNLNKMSKEMITLSRQMTWKGNAGKVFMHLATTTSEINKILPLMTKDAPGMVDNFTKLVDNMAVLTEEFKVVLPALAEVAPELPHASLRAIEALDEAVIVLKAMQKSFIFKGAAQEVLAEERKARELKKAEYEAEIKAKKEKRKPATNHQNESDEQLKSEETDW